MVGYGHKKRDEHCCSASCNRDSLKAMIYHCSSVVILLIPMVLPAGLAACIRLIDANCADQDP